MKNRITIFILEVAILEVEIGTLTTGLLRLNRGTVVKSSDNALFISSSICTDDDITLEAVCGINDFVDSDILVVIFTLS